MDDSREKRIKELIEEITTGKDYCISEAVEECRTVKDVINYIVNYHGRHKHFSEVESPGIDEAFEWLEQNIHEVDSYMEYELGGYSFVIDLINEAYYLIASSDLWSMENKLQELIDLVHKSDDEEDDNSQEKRGGNL